MLWIKFIVNKFKLCLNLFPLPVEVPRGFFVLQPEQTCILQVHKSDYFLITIVHDENPSQIVELFFQETALSHAEKYNCSQYLHLVVLFDHFSFQNLRNQLDIFFVSCHDTLSLQLRNGLVINALLLIDHLKGHIDMTCGNFLGSHDVHIFELFNEIVQFLDGLLVFVLHHSLDVS